PMAREGRRGADRTRERGTLTRTLHEPPAARGNVRCATLRAPMDGPIASRSWRAAQASLLALAIGCLGAGCARKEPVTTTFSWVLGGSEPAFDPHGPPDARRWALERLLTYGLVAEDSAGRVVPAAAESVL